MQSEVAKKPERVIPASPIKSPLKKKEKNYPQFFSLNTSRTYPERAQQT